MSAELAQQYADANMYALDLVEQISKEKKIDCDFTRLPAYTFTQSDQYVKQIEEEVEIARLLGLKASFQQDIPRSFRSKQPCALIIKPSFTV